MRAISQEHFIATNVLIKFADGSVSFPIPGGSTLADIWEKLDRIGRWHRGQPISVGVRFKALQVNGNGRAPTFL